MDHHHRMLGRNLVEILVVERAVILHLGVVVIITDHPGARRRLGGARLQFVDDALDGDEFDHIGISDQDFVQQNVAAAMVMRVVEAGHDHHALGVVGPRPGTRQRLDVGGAAHRQEPAGTHRKGLRRGHGRIHGRDLGIDHDQVRRGIVDGRLGGTEPGRAHQGGRPKARGFKKLPAAFRDGHDGPQLLRLFLRRKQVCDFCTRGDVMPSAMPDPAEPADKIVRHPRKKRNAQYRGSGGQYGGSRHSAVPTPPEAGTDGLNTSRHA